MHKMTTPKSKFNYTLTVQYHADYFENPNEELIQTVEYNMPIAMTKEQMQRDYPNCEIINVKLN